MPTKLSKPVVRVVDQSLRSSGFRDGFVVKLTPEGVYLKPPRGRWSKAYFTSWSSILLAGAVDSRDRQAELAFEAKS